MMDFVGTTQEIADFIGTDYIVANGVLRFLKDKGIVKEVGTRPAKGGKGKAATVFSIPKTFTLTFADAPPLSEAA